jgi:hypothetical protein
MRITWKHLIVTFDAANGDAILADWRWLVGDSVELFLVSSLGDLFLKDTQGRIVWLEVGAARQAIVAESGDEFKQLMQQPSHAEDWFLPHLVGDLIQSGKQLGPGQCYSYQLPPLLGGTMELDNFEPADLLAHCSMFGQIAQQTQNLPEGTRIDGFIDV